MSEIDNLVIEPVLPAFIELFDITIPTEVSGEDEETFYYTPMTKLDANFLEKHIVFDGRTYAAFPVKITGLERTTNGAPPRAELQFANVGGAAQARLFGGLAFLFGDIIGATVIYRRTFDDPAYLAGGIQAPWMKFVVRRKITHNRTGISFELRTPLDSDRSWLPGRQMMQRDFPGLGINKRYS